MLILAILLSLLLKGLVIVVLFMTIANLIQLIYQKILCLMIVVINKMYTKEINIKSQNFEFYEN